MNYLTRRKILKSTDPKDLIPVRVFGYNELDGKVIILVPKFESMFIHYLFPKTKSLFYRIKLDALGSVVWKNICDEKNISCISRVVIEEKGEKGKPPQEMQERIMNFMSILYNRRYISFRQLSDN